MKTNLKRLDVTTFFGAKLNKIIPKIDKIFSINIKDIKYIMLLRAVKVRKY